MEMKLNRFLKTIDCMATHIFDKEVSTLFNDESIRIVDVRYSTYIQSGELHYVAFVIGEYATPNDEEE